jgi:hypothetical protein
MKFLPHRYAATASWMSKVHLEISEGVKKRCKEEKET